MHQAESAVSDVHCSEVAMNESEFAEKVVDWLLDNRERMGCPLPLADFMAMLPLEFLLHTWPDNYGVDGQLREGEPAVAAGVMALVLEHLRQWHASPENMLAISAEALEACVRNFVGLSLLELMRRYGVARFKTNETGSLFHPLPLSIEWNPLVEDHLPLLLSNKSESMGKIRKLLEAVREDALASQWAR